MGIAALMKVSAGVIPAPSPREALEEAFVHLIKKYPFFASVTIQMNRIFSETIAPYAGITILKSKPTLIINPKTFPLLKVESRAALIEHEAMHFIGLHFTRKGERVKKIWDIACDLAINCRVKNLPTKEELSDVTYAVYKELIEVPREEFSVNGYFPSDYDLPDNQSAEWYYSKIIDDKELQEQMGIGEDDNDGGTGENPFDGGGRFYDRHEAWKQADSLTEDGYESIVREAVRQAAELYRDNLPGHVEEYINELLRSKVNWRMELRRFAAKCAKANRKYTWKRPSRRFPDAQGTTKERILNLVIAIDTSGSVSSTEAALFLGVVDQIYHAAKCNLWVIDCDTEIHSVVKYKPGIKIGIRGRGGTSLKEPFLWAMKQKEKFDGLIYLTDAGGPTLDHMPLPTLWAVTESGWGIMDQALPWGKKIKLEVA